MKKELLKEALGKFLAGIILMMILLFVPAGTLKWFNGWLLMGLLFVPMYIAGIVMFIMAPDLLKSRLNAKEKQDEQEKVIIYSGMMFLAAFIIAGLNFRFKWLSMPKGIVIGASIAFLLAYGLFGEVLRENRYLSRTIEVQQGQTVVDTGLYGIVRHPMYSATVILFLSMPLILGSVISFVIMLAYLPIIAKRIGNEEQVLQKQLNGYEQYCKKVKYRLIPYVW